MPFKVEYKLQDLFKRQANFQRYLTTIDYEMGNDGVLVLKNMKQEEAVKLELIIKAYLDRKPERIRGLRDRDRQEEKALFKPLLKLIGLGVRDVRVMNADVAQEMWEIMRLLNPPKADDVVIQKKAF